MKILKKFSLFGGQIFLILCIISWVPQEVASEMVRDLDSRLKPLVDPSSIFEKMSRYLPIDEEAFMRVPSIIMKEGYPVEVHDVETEDGYILETHRIPRGRDEVKEDKKRMPVLFLHMVIFSGSIWVTNTREQSAAYIFADNGYDVWIAQHRGTVYSLQHKNFDSNYTPFWNYTYDELGRYDVPALIDYVREKTGFDKIYIVCQHGAAIQLSMALALRPEYNDKIEMVVGLSPLVSAHYCMTVSNLAYQFPFLADSFFKSYRLLRGELPLRAPVVQFASRLYCYANTDLMRKITYLPFAKYDGRTTNFTRYPVFLSHFPDAMGSKVSGHLLQLMNRGVLAPYDYGLERNMKIYGQGYPPVYPLENVRVRMLATWGDNDMLVSRQEIDHLLERIKNSNVTLMKINHPGWVHVDYMFGYYARDLCYLPIIRKLRDYEKEKGLNLIDTPVA